MLECIAPLTLRWALGATLLSAVADRFGVWGPPGAVNVSWGDWPHFVAYTSKVNGFLPATLAPVLAVLAAAAELALGVALVLGGEVLIRVYATAVTQGEFEWYPTWHTPKNEPRSHPVPSPEFSGAIDETRKAYRCRNCPADSE